MNFKELREQKGLSQSEVALSAGISLMTYQLIERGVTKSPRPETLKLIEERLKSGTEKESNTVNG